MSNFFVEVMPYDPFVIQCLDSSTHYNYSYFIDVVIPDAIFVKTKCIKYSLYKIHTYFPDIYIPANSIKMDIQCKSDIEQIPTFADDTTVLNEPPAPYHNSSFNTTTTTLVPSGDSSATSSVASTMVLLGSAAITLLEFL